MPAATAGSHTRHELFAQPEAWAAALAGVTLAVVLAVAVSNTTWPHAVAGG